MASKKVKIAMVGAGHRGFYSYGERILENPDTAKVVAVAEPRDFFRNEMARQHNIPADNVFTDWKDLLEKPKLADAVIITTTDRMHRDPAVAAAEKGYHILLEKPMASTSQECIEIVEAAKKNDILLAVCHVLRYAPFYTKIKEMIDAGDVGEICSVQHFEGVSYWHQPHSFVRGVFRNVAESSFMLLAKSCHDMDMMRWWIGKKCLQVASFGELKHFRAENKPAEAADRCMDCPLADSKCQYSAKKYYFNKLRIGMHRWPLTMVIQEFTEEALEEALRSGPYGRCVYSCDNDVVDHQVVIMQFADQVTANFTMAAFTPHGRKTRIMGTRGYIEGDEHVIRILNFLSEEWTEYDVNELATDTTGGHGGGDQRLVKAFIEAVRTGKGDFIKTGPEVTLESHLMTFAAEKARLENRIVSMDEMY